MRALRTLVGLFLVLLGVPLLAAGILGAVAQDHSDPAGTFSAITGPVSSSGYAVVVPDVAQVARRHGVARLLGIDRLRVTVRSASAPVALWLVSDNDLRRYLNGVSRAEVTSVGFAGGPQPVDSIDIQGASVPSPLSQQPFWQRAPSGQTLEWSAKTDSRTSLLLIRADGHAGLDATLSVTLYPAWLGSLTTWSLVGGSAALLAALMLLLWPTRRAVVLVVEADRMVDLSDRIADRVAVRLAGRPAPTGVTRQHDWTGELIEVPVARTGSTRPDPHESPYLYTAT